MSDPTPESSTTPRPLVVLEVRASKNGRTHGKAWKSEKTATRRNYISSELKTPFEKRMEREKEKQAMKAVERKMKEEEQAAKDRKVTIIRERRERAAEKARLEAVAAKMSAKKAQRMKKRQGRSKKING
ncbi:rRNA-processing protein CGR1 [Vanrija pseudolonga]|uniref:rRNA-processing protein n=1 Tax=Vanrija pseudolonga TaxID=143232 RepID=A0AAF0Y0G7_9TREE|nr:rRNA-processing protein CGR1 [Vanrija pseudolonga]